MHNAALRELGLDWLYVPLPLPPERFAETVRALPGSGFRGINVTVPHKEAAHELASERSEAVEAIGAANTLTFGEGFGRDAESFDFGEGFGRDAESFDFTSPGAIAADNTDAGGFLDALGSSPRGLDALVLGAGGSARAVVWALREAGAAEVSVWNRTAVRARALAAALAVRQVETPTRADLLVNCTSVGLDPATTRDEALEALGLAAADPPPIVVDLVYGPKRTPLAGWAQEGGARVVEGLEVLVRQGARSLELWTGRPAPVEAMRAAARAGS